MKKILLIDDAQITRSLLRQILIGEGYVICGEASNGRIGVEEFRKHKPDLVFCDIMMHEMNGPDCLKGIMAEDPNANVVVCTSRGDQYHIDEMLAMGAKEYITKPIQRDEVIRITEKLIGKSSDDEQMSCKQRMEMQAAANGIPNKQLLDFFETFQIVNGVSFDDPQIVRKYLAEKGEEIIIGVRAMLSAKMTTEQVNQLIDIFRKLFL